MKKVAVLALLALAACADREPDAATGADSIAGAADTAAGAQPATDIGGDTIDVSFIDADGQDAGGARVIRDPVGVMFAVRLTGLTPGEHGFHVHEAGQCTAPGFESAGSHYSPEPHQHGLQNPQGPHAGDLPNLRANAEGVVDTTFTVDRLGFGGGAAPLIRHGGVALVVHADPDDYRTDPSGNSGARIACGVLNR